jgi:hypothetical protein
VTCARVPTPRACVKQTALTLYANTPVLHEAVRQAPLGERIWFAMSGPTEGVFFRVGVPNLGRAVYAIELQVVEIDPARRN